MQIEPVRQFYSAKPFRPFAIYLADGRRFDIPHPDFLSLSPQGRIEVVYGANDSINLVDPMLITSLELRGDSSFSEADAESA